MESNYNKLTALLHCSKMYAYALVLSSLFSFKFDVHDNFFTKHFPTFPLPRNSFPFPFPFPFPWKFAFHSHSHGNPMGFPFPRGILLPCTSLLLMTTVLYFITGSVRTSYGSLVLKPLLIHTSRRKGVKLYQGRRKHFDIGPANPFLFPSLPFPPSYPLPSFPFVVVGPSFFPPLFILPLPSNFASLPLEVGALNPARSSGAEPQRKSNLVHFSIKI